MRKKQASAASSEQLRMLVDEAVESAIDAPAQTLSAEPSGCLPSTIEPVELERAADRQPFGAWLVNQHQPAEAATIANGYNLCIRSASR